MQFRVLLTTVEPFENVFNITEPEINETEENVIGHYLTNYALKFHGLESLSKHPNDELFVSCCILFTC